MKTVSIMQIIAGLCITASFFVYLGFLQQGYGEMEILDSNGDVIVIWMENALRKIRFSEIIWMTVYPILGILIAGCGVARLFKRVRQTAGKGIDITQIIFGISVLGLMIVFVTSVEPSRPDLIFEQYLNLYPEAVGYRHNPGWSVLMTSWRTVCFLLGPAVAAISIRQIMKFKVAAQ